jgi:hypothetical protein
MLAHLDLSKLPPGNDDVYRVHWYGECVRPPTGRLSYIQTFLAPIHGFNESMLANSERWPRGDVDALRSFDLPIGLLPALPLGSLVSRRGDGFTLPPKDRIERFSLSEKQSYDDVRFLRADQLRPVAAKTQAKSFLGSVTDRGREAWCAVISAKPHSEKGKALQCRFVVVPCLELLRFYYGSSSALIRSVLWGQHGATEHGVKDWANPDRSGFVSLDPRIYCVCLRPNRPWSDANIVARAHTPRGLLEAKRPFVSMASARAGSPRDVGLHPKVHLPFDGPARWKVRGAYLDFPRRQLLASSDGNDTVTEKAFFVSELISCTGPFPYVHLIVEREGTIIHFQERKSEESVNEGETKSGATGERKRRRPNDTSISPGAARPGASRVLCSLHSDRFVQLRTQKPEHRLTENERRIVILEKVDPFLPKKRTYGGTNDAGDENGSRAEIHVWDDLAQLERAQRDFQDLVRRVGEYAELEVHVLGELPLSADEDPAVIEAGVMDLASSDDPAQCGFVLPCVAMLDESVAARTIGWALINRERSRRLFIATFRLEDRLVYLADVERRPGEHFKYLVARTDTDSVDPALIAQLLGACVDCQGVWSRATLSGFASVSRTVHQQGPTPEAGERLVERLARIIKQS